MRGTDDGSTRHPFNAFHPDFLHLFGERDEPPTAGEADVAGPWHVEPVGPHFGLFRAGESAAAGHRPTATFISPFYALLAAAILPGIGRDLAFRLSTEPDQEGFAVESRGDWGKTIGWLEFFDERLVEALHVALCLLASPACLTFLLEAAGAVALDRSGTLLYERVAGGPEAA